MAPRQKEKEVEDEDEFSSYVRVVVDRIFGQDLPEVQTISSFLWFTATLCHVVQCSSACRSHIYPPLPHPRSLPNNLVVPRRRHRPPSAPLLCQPPTHCTLPNSHIFPCRPPVPREPGWNLARWCHFADIRRCHNSCAQHCRVAGGKGRECSGMGRGVAVGWSQ